MSDSTNIENLSLRVDLYFTLQKYGEALKDINHIIEIDANNHKAYYDRGCIFLLRGDF